MGNALKLLLLNPQFQHVDHTKFIFIINVYAKLGTLSFIMSALPSKLAPLTHIPLLQHVLAIQAIQWFKINVNQLIHAQEVKFLLQVDAHAHKGILNQMDNVLYVEMELYW